MQIELWLSFTVASLALLVVPGPTVMLVVSYVLGRGKSSLQATVPGVALGDLTAMSISLAGAGAILATSATLFTILKLLGAAYLLWLGIQMWRAKPDDGLSVPTGEAADKHLARRGRRMFWNAYIVTALNPKGIVFFVAFVPQFVDPTAPVLSQFAILTATFVGLASCTVTCWGFLAGSMKSRVQRPATQRLVNRLGGTFLMGAGFLTAMVRRTA